MTADEQLELAALVGLAWERRGESDYRDRLEAIIDWHDRRHVRAYERRQREIAWLAQVLHETDPARLGRREAA
jgi:hypothetical protein